MYVFPKRRTDVRRFSFAQNVYAVIYENQFCPAKGWTRDVAMVLNLSCVPHLSLLLVHKPVSELNPLIQWFIIEEGCDFFIR